MKILDYIQKNCKIFLLLLIVITLASGYMMKRASSFPACHLEIGKNSYECSIGRNGIKSYEDKIEGDGATPAGIYSFRFIYYRPDRINRNELSSHLPIAALEKNDGWCDDSSLPEYNQPVKIPFQGSHENLWRDDHVYDIIAVIGYNDNPAVKNKGSAIFFHITSDGYASTAGCITVTKEDLLKIIPHLGPNSRININTSGVIKIEHPY